MESKGQYVNNLHINWTSKPSQMDNIRYMKYLESLVMSHNIDETATEVLHTHDIQLMHKVNRQAREIFERNFQRANANASVPSAKSNTDKNKQNQPLDINDIEAQIKKDQLTVQAYNEKHEDQDFVVFTNFSENDLYDAGINPSDKIAKYAVKVYGRVNDSNAQNQEENPSPHIFANIDFPVNIIQNPDKYFFSKSELNGVYQNIGSHDPTLKHWLIKSAMDSTMTVGKFKNMFGLSKAQIDARIKKIKYDYANNIPNPSESDILKYYQQELIERNDMDHNSTHNFGFGDNDDLSMYDGDYNDGDSDNPSNDY